MDTQPLISVIVPFYKTEPYLKRCVDSLLHQTYTNLQIILVDDGSPDNCGRLCDEYAQQDGRVEVIHRENGGLSAARNSGIDAAKGEYLAFVDSDDYVAEDYIGFMYDLICKHDADIASCGAMVVELSGKQTPQCADTEERVLTPREALERMCYNDGFFVTAWDKLYKAALFSTIRYPEGKVFEDTGTTYKVVDQATRIVACGEIKYFYALSQSSITTSAFNMKKLDYVEMADEMATYIVQRYPELEPAARRKQMHACFSTLTQLANADVRHPEIEKYLMNRIKPLRKGSLRDRRTPTRDKAAILAMLFGYRGFALAWRLYAKATK